MGDCAYEILAQSLFLPVSFSYSGDGSEGRNDKSQLNLARERKIHSSMVCTTVCRRVDLSRGDNVRGSGVRAKHVACYHLFIHCRVVAANLRKPYHCRRCCRHTKRTTTSSLRELVSFPRISVICSSSKHLLLFFFYFFFFSVITEITSSSDTVM